MPIRQPNGICTPALFAGVHQRRRGVHGDRLAAAREFHRAALAVRRRAGDGEALQMQPLVDAGRRPGPFGGVEHALRPARPGLPIAPVGHLVVEPRQVEPAVRLRSPHPNR